MTKTIILISFLFAFVHSFALSSEVVIKKTHSHKIANKYLKYLNDNGQSGRIIKTDKTSKLAIVYIKSSNTERVISILNQNNIKYKLAKGLILLKVFSNNTPEDFKKVKAFIRTIKSLNVSPVKTLNKLAKHQYIVVRLMGKEQLDDEPEGFWDKLDINTKKITFEQGLFSSKKDSFTNVLRSTLGGEYLFSEKFKFSFGGKLLHYTETNIAKYTNTIVTPDNTFIEYDNDSVVISLGYQCIIWGRLDALSPNDKVCPYDLNRSFISRKEDTQLSAPLLRTKLVYNKHEFDIFIKPAFTPKQLPKKSSNFYPVNFETGTIQGSTMPIGAFLTSGTIQYKDAEDLSFGGRYTIRADSFDFSANFLKSTKYAPNFFLNPDFLDEVNSGTPLIFAALNYPNNLIIMKYLSETSFGYDFSIPVDRFIFRGEHSIILDHLVTKEDFNPEEITRHEFGLSTEYTFDSPNINIIVFFNGVKNQTENVIFEIMKDYFIGFNILFTSWNENYTFETSLISSIEYKDSFFNNELSYKITDNFKLSFGLSSFLGKAKGHFGFFKGNDLAYLNLSGDF